MLFSRVMLVGSVAERGRRRILALALALAVTGSVAWSLSTCEQLGWLTGLTDEWMMVGANLAVHGTVGYGDEPWLLRPPGYPAFLALPLLLAGPPPTITPAYLDRVLPLAYAAQGIVLVATAALAFGWLSSWLPSVQAMAASLALALSPISLIQVGLLQYGTLHLFFLVGGLALLARAVDAWPQRPASMAGAGVIWGLATLVRPTTLLCPSSSASAWRSDGRASRCVGVLVSSH